MALTQATGSLPQKKHLTSSNPQLPQQVWKRFKEDYPESIIFTTSFSIARHGLVTREFSPSSSEGIPKFAPQIDGIQHFLGLDPTWLHLATTSGDLPLACEALRLGTPIQQKERRGFSALYFGCGCVENCVHRRKFREDSINSYIVPKHLIPAMMEKYDQILKVCIFLVEQHSDPDETHNAGVTLLHLACSIGSWDLIRVLILHGAKHSRQNPLKMLPIDTFESPSDKARFRALVSECSTKTRPPRPCPCASGLPLAECHATDQPYPGEYICPCKSRRIHSKCCQKKDTFAWHEIWDDEHQFEFKRKPLNVPDSSLALMVEWTTKVERMSLAERRNCMVSLEFIQRVRAIIHDLALRGMIDLAFASAVEKIGYPPRPGLLEMTTRTEGKSFVEKWNQAVDDYIESGVDRRPRKSIENAAMLGMAGGPLYRKCEADGCPNVEGRDSVKLLVCSGCVTAVYCNKGCQKSAWKSHKPACLSGTVKVQVLPSQLVYFDEMLRVTGLELY
ncbi:hypothetical protein C8R44DRAFT_825635 [Mycena epipterygia]|nr:hypothetical protein C8R44DRAFT_825635 [Mycena epipterygia]